VKKYLRNIHIDGKEWIWYVRGNNDSGDIIIISPEKKRYVVPMKEFIDNTYLYSCKISVTPGNVKEYIQDKIMTFLLEDGPVA